MVKNGRFLFLNTESPALKCNKVYIFKNRGNNCMAVKGMILKTQTFSCDSVIFQIVESFAKTISSKR